jgi:hypothetical protein
VGTLELDLGFIGVRLEIGLADFGEDRGCDGGGCPRSSCIARAPPALARDINRILIRQIKGRFI